MNYAVVYKEMRRYLGDNFNERQAKSTVQRAVKTLGMDTDDFKDFLRWWYDIKGNDPARSNGGVGILTWKDPDTQEYRVYQEFQEWKKRSDNISAANIAPPQEQVTETYSSVAKPKRRFPYSFKNFRLS